MAISMVGCATHAARPTTIDMAKTQIPADLAPIPPPLPAELTAPRPCSLHGTGFSSGPVVIVPSKTDTTPRAFVYGNLTTGAEWNDVPPPGTTNLARFTYNRSGVRIQAFAPFQNRSFWLAQKAESFDGLAWIRPNRQVRTLGVDSGEAIIEIDEPRVRPMIVTARTACEDLGTDTSVHTEETAPPGTPVHVKSTRWLHLRAKPGGPSERDVEANTGQITRTTTQNGFVFVHVRFTSVDTAGWIAVSELTERSGGIGLGTIGRGVTVRGACSGSEHHVTRTTALRVGPSSIDTQVLGEIAGSTAVFVRNIEGHFAKIDIVPCEITPATDQAFWVDAGAVD